MGAHGTRTLGLTGPRISRARAPQPAVGAGDHHLHPHFHGADPADVAALIRRIGDEDI